MPASQPMKPAAPHLVVGLSSRVPERGDLKELVRRYFSPLPPAESELATHTQLDSLPEQLLIQLIEQAFLDTQQDEIPSNTAVFLVLSEPWLRKNDLSRSLSEHFRATAQADLTIMVSTDVGQSLSEALIWLDRGECEFAMVAACDFDDLQARAAAVLIANAASANRQGIRAYASLENPGLNTGAQIDLGAIALIEVTGKDWLESAEPSRQWQSSRQKSRQDFEALNKNAVWTRHDSLCYASCLALELAGGSARLTPVFALLVSSLALHLRVIPGASLYELQLDKSAELVQCKTARPWIHPVSPVEPAHPRRCFCNLGADAYILSEQGDDINTITLRNLQEQSSELFIYSGRTVDELKENIARRAAALLLERSLSLAELAFRQNCPEHELADYKLALVASSRQELESLMQAAISHLAVNPDSALTQIGIRGEIEAASVLPAGNKRQEQAPTLGVSAALKKQILSQSTGIYYTGRPAAKPGKIVFVFPGLGAAYPQMLADLCFFFPEVRQVFDFVERLALRAGDKVIPSRAIFPAATGSQSSSQAMLATMDSSVVTLLLAEWAIYALLKKLGVAPDILLGCSTGEFAAMTISEAVKLFEAAQIFYTLSTHVSRSIPLSQLSELRSVRVAASCQKVILPLLAKMDKTVYVGADLSDTCVLLSGQKAAIDELCKLLRQNKIDYLTLPVAVPYHTPLVSGKISEADVELLEMSAPRVETWSCSIAGKYPVDGAMLRKISTDLFEKPILLRSTIQRLYDEADARIFVEVGPKGGLVPFISEILSGKEHLAVAANLAAKSGIDQFNALLAVLVCHGVDMNLAALYQRRVAASRQARHKSRLEALRRADEFDFPTNELELRRSVDFELENLPSGNPLEALSAWSQSSFNAEQLISDLLGGGFDIFSEAGLSDEVMITYLASMQQMHASLMGTQERLLMAYLLGDEEAPADAFKAVRLPGDYAFLPGAALHSPDDCFCIEFCLSTTQHPFLLDHAIGGSVNSGLDARVCLLPLMVALEIMAEGASLLFPEFRVVKLSDIRAYKRIRANRRDLNLLLELRAVKENCIEARICLQNAGQDESGLLASCVVEFSEDLPEGPAPAAFPVQDSRASRLSPHKLYGEGSMFHGPAMQSVESIDLVSKRSIEGRITCRHSDNWFKGQAVEEAAHLILDPLLLDNASQFVLYQMYEHEMPVTALLPFHVGSIEFFQGYENLRGDKIFASAYLRSMNLRGTEAEIQLTNPDGRIVARINEISSRAIVLPENFRKFVSEPANSLCRRIEIEQAPGAVICAIERTEMPEDETALDWATDYILTESEQSEWRQVGRTEKRRLDWLMGRIAAKDAVKELLRREFGLALKACDIEIRRTESGNAEAYSVNVETPWTPQISISHCNKIAVAIAEAPRQDRHSGIDVEEIVERDDGFAELACTQNELDWLDSKPISERALQIARLWTAKESAAKSCGSGLSGNPKLFELLVTESSENVLKIRAGVCGHGRSGSYNCLVSTDKVDKVSLAIVVDYLES